MAEHTRGSSLLFEVDYSRCDLRTLVVPLHLINTCHYQSPVYRSASASEHGQLSKTHRPHFSLNPSTLQSEAPCFRQWPQGPDGLGKPLVVSMMRPTLVYAYTLAWRDVANFCALTDHHWLRACGQAATNVPVPAGRPGRRRGAAASGASGASAGAEVAVAAAGGTAGAVVSSLLLSSSSSSS